MRFHSQRCCFISSLLLAILVGCDEDGAPLDDGTPETCEPAFETITPLGRVAVPYSFTLDPGCDCPAATIVLSAGELPPGLDFDGTMIAGTPEAAGFYDASFVYNAPCDAVSDATLDLQFDVLGPVACEELELVESLPRGLVGSAYTVNLFQDIGGGPRDGEGMTTLALTGDLPDGLVFDASAGTISGTPTAVDSAQLTLDASDECPPLRNGPQTQQRIYTLEVVDTCPAMEFNTARRLPQGAASQFYGPVDLVIEGTPPYAVTLVTGTLPQGIGLNSMLARLSGTPSTPGTSVFTLEIRDSCPVPVVLQREYTLQVNPF